MFGLDKSLQEVIIDINKKLESEKSSLKWYTEQVDKVDIQVKSLTVLLDYLINKQKDIKDEKND